MLCIELLETFSEKEREDFGELISCRYFNTDKYVIRLYIALQQTVLGKQSYNAAVQATLFQKVFEEKLAPEAVLHKKQRMALQYKVNALKQLAEQFLMLETQRAHDRHKNDLLYPALLARQQFRLFSRHANRDKKQLEETVTHTASYYAQRYQIENHILDYLHQNGKLLQEDNLPELNHHLDLYYLLSKLDLYLTALSLQWVSGNKSYGEQQRKAIESLLDNPAYAALPLVRLYLANIELFTKQSPHAYAHLLDLLTQYSAKIPVRLHKHFYATAINYCTHQIKSGQLDYLHNMFGLYQLMDEKGLIVEEGFIPIGRLKNMIVTACRVGAFDWAKKLLAQYRKFIRQAVRENVYQFNLGLIAFYQKDYETAHTQLSRTGQINLAYDINTRVLILKCLYEKGADYNEPTMQAFRTAEIYFKNNKLLPTRSKKAFKNFIRILINLYRIRHGASRMALGRLREKLEQQAFNSDKQWLLEQIAVLG